MIVEIYGEATISDRICRKWFNITKMEIMT